ncbi:hypothetical protein SAMN05428978_10556 [Nitrosomonas sp. Nm34]|nr:hypothetical protein SAMN05428978_10556 [Nitrosomonas sp. Nm34]
MYSRARRRSKRSRSYASIFRISRSTRETVRRFRTHSEAMLRKQYLVHHDEEQLIATEKQAAAQLEELFEQDANVAGGRDRATANMS